MGGRTFQAYSYPHHFSGTTERFLSGILLPSPDCEYDVGSEEKLVDLPEEIERFFICTLLKYMFLVLFVSRPPQRLQYQARMFKHNPSTEEVRSGRDEKRCRGSNAIIM